MSINSTFVISKKRIMKIKKFTFNPFQENTYIIYNDEKDCLIVDPGCFDRGEEKIISEFIGDNQLRPIQLVNTHFHIDHVLGNKFITDRYKIEIAAYNSEYPMLEMAKRSAEMYGIPYNESPKPTFLLKENDTVHLGETEFNVLFVPGHSPDHIVLVNKEEKIMIGGDVLFKGSIGRTDLPGGNHSDDR